MESYGYRDDYVVPGCAVRVLITAEQLRRTVPGGIGTYVRSLFGALDSGHAVVPVAWASRGLPATLGLPPAVQERLSILPGPVLTRLWDRGVVGAPKDVDRVHATSLAVPPHRRNGPPLSCFVHDLAWRRTPDAYPGRGRHWHVGALGRAIARCDLLMAPSRQTADDLLAAGADHHRVYVVPEGCDHLSLFPRPANGGEYLLSVSTLEPRKNLRRLVEAYQLARPHMNHPWPLRIVGPTGWGEDLGHLAHVDGVEMLGPVDDTALARLLADARALAYVPLVEGFGLPAVEAMRAGIPVLSSSVPSVAPGTTVLVDPLDVNAMAVGLVRVLEHEDTRMELTVAAAAHTRPLTWAASAAAHVTLWQK